MREVQFETPSSLRQIKKYSFSQCSSLISICVPSLVEVLGEACFSGCDSLHSVVFESQSHLRQIQKSVFSRCPNLEVLCLPDSVESLLDGWDRRSSVTTLQFESADSFNRIASSCSDSLRDQYVIKIAGRPDTSPISTIIPQCSRDYSSCGPDGPSSSSKI
jgi:hypothetical protein